MTSMVPKMQTPKNANIKAMSLILLIHYYLGKRFPKFTFIILPCPGKSTGLEEEVKLELFKKLSGKIF